MPAVVMHNGGIAEIGDPKVLLHKDSSLLKERKSLKICGNKPQRLKDKRDFKTIFWIQSVLLVVNSKSLLLINLSNPTLA